MNKDEKKIIEFMLAAEKSLLQPHLTPFEFEKLCVHYKTDHRKMTGYRWVNVWVHGNETYVNVSEHGLDIFENS